MLDRIKPYIALIVITVLVTSVISLYVLLHDSRETIKELNDSLSLSNSKLQQATANNVSLQSTILDQNTKVAMWQVDRDNTLEAYNKLLQQPEKIRFKNKYLEVESNECKDIMLILDDVRSNGF